MSSSKGSNDSDTESYVSQTSTELYVEQEAFETFQHRIRTLCTTLWPSVPSEAFIIEKMRGGSYNRVSGITVPVTSEVFGSLEEEKYILRVPREPSVSIESELAILSFIRQNTSIPVPEMVFFDLTCKNPLGIPYNIQPRIPGVPLEGIWKELPQEDKLVIIQQFANFLCNMHKIRSLSPGYLSAAKAVEDNEDRKLVPEVRIVDFLIKTFMNIEGDIVRGGMSDDSAEHKTTFQLLIDQFDSWQEFGRFFNRGTPEDELMEKFREVTRKMEQLDLLEGNDFVLFHPDLYPRNIMVTKGELGGEVSRWKISGILDWEGATYAPYTVACVPPTWIWDNWDDEEDESVLCKMPDDPEAQERRKLFDTLMGISYTGRAYPDRHRFVRRLFDLARVGFSDTQQHKEAGIFFPEWDEFFKIAMEARTTSETEAIPRPMIVGRIPKKALATLEVREGPPASTKTFRGLAYGFGNKFRGYCNIQ